MTDIKKASRPKDAPTRKRPSKDKHFIDQFAIVYKGFFEQPQTMKMLSVKSNIDRANICWYCRDLRKSEKLAAVKKGICSITKHKATYWTTNPALFPISSQLKMF